MCFLNEIYKFIGSKYPKNNYILLETKLLLLSSGEASKQIQ